MDRNPSKLPQGPLSDGPLDDETTDREFWAKADSTQYVDGSRERRVILPNLKPSLKTISLRLPESMLEELKLMANKRDAPHQSLIKIILAERLEDEFGAAGSAGS